MRLVAIGIAALALAACGGGDGGQDDDYAKGLVSALASVEKPAAADAASLAAFADDYGQAAEELSGLTPPPEIAEPHARMVAAMRAYADDLERASHVTGDPFAFTTALARAQESADAWTAAFEEIRSRGYATVSLGS